MPDTTKTAPSPWTVDECRSYLLKARAQEQGSLAESFMTVPEVASFLVVSQSTVTRLIRCGDLHAFKVGGTYRVTVLSLACYMALNGTTPGAWDHDTV